MESPPRATLFPSATLFRSHFVQATVVERAAVEGGDIGAAAGRHIAGLVDLAVVVPATFAARVTQEHAPVPQRAHDPQCAAGDAANAGFGDSINRDSDGRLF